MSKGTPENKERNLSLFNDFKTGNFSIIDLVKKYDITPARIYQIVRKVETKLSIDNGIE